MRLFLAVELSSKTKKEIDDQLSEIKKIYPQFQWLPSDNYHITVNFFGEISDSKKNSLTFVYPSGRFNDRIVSLVKEAGFLVALTTKIGIARDTSNLLEIPRVRVENTTPQALIDKISYAQEQGQN